jgi:hypothetical protein
MITAHRFLVIKGFFLNREMKKLTSLSSDILVASIHHDLIGLSAPKRCSRRIAQLE